MPTRTERRTGSAPRPPAAAEPSEARFGDGGAPATTAPPKLRRRTGLIALGIALVCLGGAGAAYLTTAVGDTSAVVAVADGVQRGAVIHADDLTVARINADPALKTVPESQLNSIIGQRAAVDLAAGSILTPSSTTTDTVPAQGQSLVGVALKPAQLPATSLVAGDQVRIIATPREQDQAPSAAPTAYTATVVGVRNDSTTGQVIVDVTVPSATAGQLAAQVATGRIALVLDSEAHR